MPYHCVILCAAESKFAGFLFLFLFNGDVPLLMLEKHLL